MTITLPCPPSVNHLYATVRGRRVLSAQGRAYKNNAALLAYAKGIRPIVGPVSVAIDVYRKRKAGDLDNFLKATFDALKGVAWIDDSQVAEIFAMRFDDKANPRVEIRVEALDASVVAVGGSARKGKR